ncbi:hypothetical protein ACJX0J_017953, partial [Zea mays]
TPQGQSSVVCNNLFNTPVEVYHKSKCRNLFTATFHTILSSYFSFLSNHVVDIVTLPFEYSLINTCADGLWCHILTRFYKNSITALTLFISEVLFSYLHGIMCSPYLCLHALYLYFVRLVSEEFLEINFCSVYILLKTPLKNCFLNPYAYLNIVCQATAALCFLVSTLYELGLIGSHGLNLAHTIVKLFHNLKVICHIDL